MQKTRAHEGGKTRLRESDSCMALKIGHFRLRGGGVASKGEANWLIKINKTKEKNSPTSGVAFYGQLGKVNTSKREGRGEHHHSPKT